MGILSPDGKGRTVFHVKCLEGQNFGVNFHKTQDIGELEIEVTAIDKDRPEPNNIIYLDDGNTDAAFGGVLLTATKLHFKL